MLVRVCVDSSKFRACVSLSWRLTVEGMGFGDIRSEVVNMAGETSSYKVVWNAVQAVQAARGTETPQARYGNCGRKRKLSLAQEQAIVDFVKKWRHKRFCTCNYIRASLKLPQPERVFLESFAEGPWTQCRRLGEATGMGRELRGEDPCVVAARRVGAGTV